MVCTNMYQMCTRWYGIYQMMQCAKADVPDASTTVRHAGLYQLEYLYI